MPDDNKVRRRTEMRAPTAKERIGDFLRSAYEGISEQPLGRVSDALGMSDFAGIVNENPNAMKSGVMPGPPGMGRAFNIAKSHPSLPPEFNMTRSSRTGPIDMNEMPSGRMEFLDPDVADFVNPTRPDPTTREGQNRLKVLQYLMGNR